MHSILERLNFLFSGIVFLFQKQFNSKTSSHFFIYPLIQDPKPLYYKVIVISLLLSFLSSIDVTHFKHCLTLGEDEKWLTAGGLTGQDNRNYTLSDARDSHKTKVSYVGSWPSIKKLYQIINITIIHNTLKLDK